MGILLRHTRFIHVPKCAGTFVRQALKAACPYHAMYGTPERQNNHLGVSKAPGEGLFTFCTLRDPADWHASYWGWRCGKYGLGPVVSKVCNTDLLDAPFDCYMSLDFQRFISGVIRDKVGAFDPYYDEFLDKSVHVVPLMDDRRLVDQLIDLLECWDEEFDEDVLRDFAPANVSDKSKFQATWLPGQKEQVRWLNPRMTRLYRRAVANEVC